MAFAEYYKTCYFERRTWKINWLNEKSSVLSCESVCAGKGASASNVGRHGSISGCTSAAGQTGRAAVQVHGHWQCR